MSAVVVLMHMLRSSYLRSWLKAAPLVKASHLSEVLSKMQGYNGLALQYRNIESTLDVQ